MLRLLLLISLLFSTVAVMVHGVLLYRQAATASMITEEESPEQQPLLKAAKELSNEQIGFPLNFFGQNDARTLYKAAFCKTLRFSKGFYVKPYNPPDAG